MIVSVQANLLAGCFDGAPRGNGSELAGLAAPDAGSDKARSDAGLDGPFPTVVSPPAIWGQVRMGMRLSMSSS
jgi:hypothetical protein